MQPRLVLFVAFWMCVLCWLPSCSQPELLCKDYSVQYYVVHGKYAVNAVDVGGIMVDATEGYDVGRIARAIDATDQCLRDLGKLPKSEAEAAWCIHNEYKYKPINRLCFETKVAPYLMSCDGKEQLLDVEAPFQGCAQKGFEFDPACPCRWRTVVQDNYQIITTPNLRMYGDSLVRLATGCEAPFESPSLARCASVAGQTE